jgi:maltooligosyltrehalose trehalohydrolase
VEVVVAGTAQPLAALAGGWHAARLPGRDGQDYAYRLDGGPPRPDPASWRQPEGVHGPSRLVDPAALPGAGDRTPFRPAPLSAAVYYELHVGTFTPEGTLDTAAQHLGPLADLGVTHVELQPLNAFNGPHGWGYDGVGWYAVHEPYGGPAALARFVDAAHGLGLAVVVDAVYNHLGPSGNYLGEFGPYQTEAYATPWGPAVNLDGPDCDPVRAFLVGSALHWLADLRVDALRLDAVHGLVDTSPVHVLAELAGAVATAGAALGRHLALIAESDRNDPRTVAPVAGHGLGMDAQWADDLHHAIHVAVTGEHDGYYADHRGLPDVARAYRNGFSYDGRWSPSRRRRIGAPLPDDVPGWRLVGCTQNHDQIGNRAAGDRLTTLVDADLVRVAVVLLCAAPHAPLLFMGEEYGETAPFQFFTSHPEPELAEAVRQGRAREFAAFAAFGGGVPDPQDPATLAASRLDRSRADTPDGRARRALWRDLLAARRRVPALADGRRDRVATVTATDRLLAVVRGDADGDRVLVAANLGDDDAVVATGLDGWEVLLATGDPAYGGTGALPIVQGGSVRIPGRSATLLHRPAPDLV